MGLFSFGMLTKRILPKGYGVTVVCLLAPAICYALGKAAPSLFDEYQIGFEMLLINGMLTFLGLWMLSKKPDEQIFAFLQHHRFDKKVVES